MRFAVKAPGAPRRLGILAAAFHPPTIAHLALAHAALDHAAADEVVFVLPCVLPHKEYAQVGFHDRLEMVKACIRLEPRFSAATTEGGLFLEIARECRATYGPGVRLRFLCGRDTAERIVAWQYGDLPDIQAQLEEFDLLVASRGGAYQPPEPLQHAIEALPVPARFDDVSSTRVREMAGRGENWRPFVPVSIHPLIERLYS